MKDGGEGRREEGRKGRKEKNAGSVWKKII
jgi:hypothetical protein